MEGFAILFSGPVAFVASLIYREALLALRSHWNLLKSPFLAASYLVLGAIVAEWITLWTWGIIGTRERLGLIYEYAHLAAFILGTPALVNVAVWLRPKPVDWLLTAIPASVLAVSLVLMQYAVSEALYGMEGDTGLYSSPRRTGLLRR